MEPTYRIVVVPAEPKEGLIDTTKDEIRNILRDPPPFREDGFGFRGVHPVRGIRGGCTGTGTAQQTVTLLKNGLLELSCPLLNRHFQWYKDERGFSEYKWLYPYAVAEMPLTFILMAQKLYRASDYERDFIVQQDYFNVNGFVLVPGHPLAHGFGLFKDELKLFDQQTIEGDQHKASLHECAWNLSEKLVFEVYDSFQLGREAIPRFRELMGFRFRFDYMEFAVRYRYTVGGIRVDVFGDRSAPLRTYEFAKGDYRDEGEAISKGVGSYKKEVLEQHRHPEPMGA